MALKLFVLFFDSQIYDVVQKHSADDQNFLLFKQQVQPFKQELRQVLTLFSLEVLIILASKKMVVIFVQTGVISVFQLVFQKLVVVYFEALIISIFQKLVVVYLEVFKKMVVAFVETGVI